MGGDHLWDAIGAVVQMLGSIAVFITLWYLAIQVRHARNEGQRSISRARSDALQGLIMANATDERLNATRLKMLGVLGVQPSEFEAALIEKGLTREEAAIMNWQLLAWWQYREHIILYRNELVASERTQFERQLRSAYGSGRPMGLWYELTKEGLNPAAVRYIDSLLAMQR